MLRVILESPDESAVHDFRVCMKRLTALYGFLGEADGNLSVKKLLKPYRVLFKKLGSIRDAHIAIGLVEDLQPSPNPASKRLLGLLKSGIRRDYRNFRSLVGTDRAISIKLPTLRATGISQAAISRHRPIYLDRVLSQILSTEEPATAAGWHRKRILLKRYRHTQEALSPGPGQPQDPGLQKQIALLEQLLGDWHDRVVTADLLQALAGPAADPAVLIRQLKSQHRALLGTAKIYLGKFAQSEQGIVHS
jgi:CHAD domain-containing protein